MAKQHTHKNQELEGKETVEVFQDLDQKALQTEKWIERNAKKIAIAFGLILAGILGYFLYQNFVEAPKNAEAAKSYLIAMKNLEQQKDKEALSGSAGKPGFLGIYNEYSHTQVGKLSAYNAASIKIKQGKYAEALGLLEKFDSKNDVLNAMKFGLMADCQANLNKGTEAMSLLDQAIGTTKDPYTQYYFTRKAGLLALALNKKGEAKKYFGTIAEKYADYDNGMSDAMIEMVKYY